jgi:hypothetical protein
VVVQGLGSGFAGVYAVQGDGSLVRACGLGYCQDSLGNPTISATMDGVPDAILKQVWFKFSLLVP